MDASFLLPGFFGGSFPTGAALFAVPAGQVLGLTGLAAAAMLLLLPMRAAMEGIPAMEAVFEGLGWDLGEVVDRRLKQQGLAAGQRLARVVL